MLTLAEKYDLVDRTDLKFSDGCPAYVRGACLPFPTVVSYGKDAKHEHRHEYAWQTVADIVNSGKTFAA